MSKKFHSDKPRRALGNVDEAPKVLDPFDGFTQKDFRLKIAELEKTNAALKLDNSQLRNETNTVLAMLGTIYQFLFALPHAYAMGLEQWKEAGNEKAIPVGWVASRVVEAFDAIFNQHPVARMGIGPNRDLLRQLNGVATKKVNPGSHYQAYVGLPETPVSSDDISHLEDIS